MRLFRQLTINDELLEPFPFKREISMQAYLMENEQLLNLGNTEDIQIYDEEVTLDNAGKENQDGTRGKGRVDLIATFDNEQIAVIELKHKKLNFEALKQLARYLEQKGQLLKLENNPIIDADAAGKEPIKWVGILVGPSICSSLAKLISDGTVNKKISTIKDIPIAALTIERFRGNSGNIHIITDTYFSKANNGMDRTQYSFKGKKYGKGRLVLAVITDYVIANETKTLASLKKIFPDKIQGNQTVVSTREDAEKIYTDKGRKRHFIKESEIIALHNDDKKVTEIAVSNQWGIGNIDKFLEAAKKLKYKIKY